MHLLSTVNSQTKSAQDLPVIVLSCSNRQKFVQRPSTYAELVTLAEDKYHLRDQSSEAPTRLIFTTSTLDICQGKDIEIDETAYSLLAPVLDEIKVKRVRLGEGHGLGAHSETANAPMTPPMESDDGAAPAPAGPSNHATSTKAAGKRPAVERVYDSTHEYPPTSTRSVHAKTVRMEVNEAEVVATPAQARTPAFEEPPQPQVASRTTRAGSASPKKPSRAGVFKGLAQTIVLTPVHQPAASTPAHEEAEEEEIIEIEHIPAPAVAVADTTPARGHHSRRGKINAPASKTPEDDAASDKTATPRQQPRTHRTPAKPQSGGVSGSGADDRFMIHVTGLGHEADFKTRGKHTVKKVLAGACKNWHLDYERARLILIVEENGREERFICEPEMTMTECGVDPGSKLEVEVDEDEQDESELEDEGGVEDDLLEFD